MIPTIQVIQNQDLLAETRFERERLFSSYDFVVFRYLVKNEVEFLR